MDSSGQIQITATGAQATNALHQVAFTGNLNLPGAIDLTLSDGRHLTSSILGLSYLDTASGNSVWIGEVKDSFGLLLPSGSQALYPDAFTGCTADVLYENSIARFDQLVVLREQLPSPSEWGLDPATTVLQVITEFFSGVEPAISQAVVAGALDEALDFGPMQMVRGVAFGIGSEVNTVPVTKRWRLLDSRQCLVEEVPLAAIAPLMIDLAPAPPHVGGLPASPDSPLYRVASTPQLPPRKTSLPDSPALQLAGAQPERKGLALDYTLVSNQSNMVFEADKTYYLSTAVNLIGTTVIEGGSVIKVTNRSDAGITLAGPLVCKTGAVPHGCNHFQG